MFTRNPKSAPARPSYGVLLAAACLGFAAGAFVQKRHPMKLSEFIAELKTATDGVAGRVESMTGGFKATIAALRQQLENVNAVVGEPAEAERAAIEAGEQIITSLKAIGTDPSEPLPGVVVDPQTPVAEVPVVADPSVPVVESPAPTDPPAVGVPTTDPAVDPATPAA